jgi:ATP-dependent helicase HrpB
MPPALSDRLPVSAIREELLDALEQGPAVLSSPTGSGKSTLVPLWCPQPVIVVEPRRVACRTLAARVADLAGSALGSAVGYRVRDEQRWGPETRITFITPGVALHQVEEFARQGTLILDEFHERRWDVDLLLALARRRCPRLLVMSATLDGDRVAQYLRGRHLQVAGRMHPVRVQWVPGDVDVPSMQGLERRVNAALRLAQACPGDVLVFLPGKGEVAKVRRTLEDDAWEVLELHGGMPVVSKNSWATLKQLPCGRN